MVAIVTTYLLYHPPRSLLLPAYPTVPPPSVSFSPSVIGQPLHCTTKPWTGNHAMSCNYAYSKRAASEYCQLTCTSLQYASVSPPSLPLAHTHSSLILSQHSNNPWRIRSAFFPSLLSFFPISLHSHAHS